MTAELLGALGTPKAYAKLPSDAPPLLMVIVDTEESFDWSLPLACENTSVTSMTEQAAAHEIFAKYGVVPTYVIDYPVAATDRSAATLAEYLKAGVCEIGAHLHPWVNPPHEEDVNQINSYPGNLPADLERAKLAELTAVIETNLGVVPRVYKAGRYGVGPNTAQTLEEAGYDIDLSVVAHTSFVSDGGPDFTRSENTPYWFGERRRILEIPLSCGFTGAFAATGPKLYPRISANTGMKLHLPGLMARSRLLERIRLTPEGAGTADHRRLLDAMRAQGQKIFTMAYHSPSLEPGNTPYVRDKSDLKDFLETLDKTCAYFFNDLGGKSSTPTQLFAQLAENAAN